MKSKETISVFIDTEKGNTVCICSANNKGCRKHCQPDIVIRDKFRGWKNTMHRDKYGKS